MCYLYLAVPYYDGQVALVTETDPPSWRLFLVTLWNDISSCFSRYQWYHLMCNTIDRHPLILMALEMDVPQCPHQYEGQTLGDVVSKAMHGYVLCSAQRKKGLVHLVSMRDRRRINEVKLLLFFCWIPPGWLCSKEFLAAIDSLARIVTTSARNKRCCMILPTKIVQLRRAHSGLSLNEIIVDKQLFVLFALDCFHSHLDIVRGWHFCSIIYAAPWQLLWQPEECRTEENIARLSAACSCVQHFFIKATGNGKMVELATPIVARVWLHSGRSGLLSAVATSPEASGEHFTAHFIVLLVLGSRSLQIKLRCIIKNPSRILMPGPRWAQHMFCLRVKCFLQLQELMSTEGNKDASVEYGPLELSKRINPRSCLNWNRMK